jgi:hypothetical protein
MNNIRTNSFRNFIYSKKLIFVNIQLLIIIYYIINLDNIL